MNMGAFETKALSSPSFFPSSPFFSIGSDALQKRPG
jgi:hypothetical protein